VQGDPDDLRSKVLKILSLPRSEWQELSAAARRAAVKRWSWERVAALLLSRDG
jgi:glycosyltransferase involved in cell wall biosynthesis